MKITKLVSNRGFENAASLLITLASALQIGCGAWGDGAEEISASDSEHAATETSALAIACDSGPTGSKCAEYTSNLLTVRMKTCPASAPAPGIQTRQCPGEPGFVVVGGGGAVVGTPSPGALMTGSYLVEPGRDAWQATFKTHNSSVTNYQAQAYSISLKIKGWSQATLQSSLRVVTATSSVSARPSVTAKLPDGYVLIGGGGYVQGEGFGELLMDSQPFGTTWTVGGSWHIVEDQGTATAMVIGIRSLVGSTAFSSHVVSSQGPNVSSGYSSVSNFVLSSRVVSSIGGVSVHDGRGRFLTHLIPFDTGVNTGRQGYLVRSKDRSHASEGSTRGHAVALGASSIALK